MLKSKLLKKFNIAVAVIFTVAACTGGGGGGTTPTPTPGQQNQGATILIWWNLFEPEENVRPLIEAYEAAHPNVDVQYDQKGVNDGVAGYRQTLDTVINDGDKLSTPDIFTIHNSWVGAYEKSISPAPNLDAASLGDFYQVVRDDFTSGTNVLGLPLYVDALAVIYNKTKLISSGYTVPSEDWTEFQTQAQNLTQKGSNNSIVSAGFSAFYPENTEFAFDLLNLLMLQNDVKMVNDARDEAIFANDSEINKSQSAFDFYRSFISGQKSTWTKTQKKDIASFLEKKLAMYAAPSWRLLDILDYNSTFGLDLDVGVATIPQLGGGDQTGWATYWGQTVSKDSSNTDIAWDFINFITQTEQLRTLSDTVKANGRSFGILYPRISMATEITDDADVKDILGPYLQSVSRAKNWYMYDGDLVKAAFNEALTGSTNLDNLESNVTRILTSDDE